MPKQKTKTANKRSKKSAPKQSGVLGASLSFELKLALILCTIGCSTGLLALGYFTGRYHAANGSISTEQFIALTQLSSAQSTYHNEQLAPKKITISDLVANDISRQVYANGDWTISEHDVSHLYTSAYPYEPGNIIIYGHNKPTVFAPLHQVKVGETVTLTLQNGTTRKYSVDEIAIVFPNDVSYLQPTDSEVLTIFTCTGFLDSKRLVLRAMPI